ncbi:ABC transporter permease [Corynebacterium crudilactis]|uniref:Multidrug ABC transporter permease n=1 Tax=Corynebacterium crudilactis TaxID=1652495 RepID=A0A172QTU4_9CORY|nr:ABC transporter permease [Corynebacterium crudilactis]ANE04080.1 multidrug ABC transporter permease [Corynebacterium crudilactis]
MSESSPLQGTSRFPAGTFTPAPKRATPAKMLAAQGKMESLLFLRHGEQQLLSIIIPLVALIALANFDLVPGETSLNKTFPFALATAAMSSGFTGQAISLAFDRRYGALKRTGASGVPAWTIIFGKVIAVLAVTIVQIIILGSVALLLGWTAPIGGVLFGILTLFVGVASFTAFGMLMGGTMSSELVLALANLIWVILSGLAAWAVFSPSINASGWLSLIPSISLSQGMVDAFNGQLPWLQLAILAGWLTITGVAANKLFSFSSNR